MQFGLLQTWELWEKMFIEQKVAVVEAGGFGFGYWIYGIILYTNILPERRGWVVLGMLMRMNMMRGRIDYLLEMLRG